MNFCHVMSVLWLFRGTKSAVATIFLVAMTCSIAHHHQEPLVPSHQACRVSTMRVWLLVLALLGVSSGSVPCRVWMNSSLTPAQRAEALLVAMSLDECVL
jgi:hypothetical protein